MKGVVLAYVLVLASTTAAKKPFQKRPIVFPTVPRSGNSWTRRMWEAVTGDCTYSVYEPYRVTNEGYRAAKKETVPSINLNPDRPLLKTHYPFLGHRPMDTHNPSFIVNSIRNPLSEWDAWKRYQKDHSRPSPKSFKTFLSQYRHFHDYWDSVSIRGARQCYRFEDLQGARARAGIMHRIISASGAMANRTMPTVNKVAVLLERDDLTPSATSRADPRHLLQEHSRFGTEDVEHALKTIPDFLRRLNYWHLYAYWHAALNRTPTAPEQELALADLKSGDGTWNPCALSATPFI